MAAIERCLETGGDPTIDIERMAIDEGRRLAGQEHCGADQLLDVAPAPSGCSLFEPAREFRIVDQRLVERGLEIAWRNRIDLKAVFRPIGAHAAGQVLDRALGGGVRRNSRPREFALHGGDVDDLAMATSDHVTGDGLADIERARNIGGEQLLPFLDGKVLERRAELHAGIVDQDIDRPKISLDRLDTLRNGWRARHVEFGYRYLVP